MRRILSLILVALLACQPALAFAQQPVDTYELLREMIGLIAQGEPDMLLTLTEGTTGESASFALLLDQQGLPAIEGIVSGNGVISDTKNLYLYEDGTAYGFSLKSLLEAAILELTGLTALPDANAGDLQVLAALGRQLVQGISSEALSITRTEDKNGSLLQICFDLPVFCRDVHNAVSAILREQSTLIDPLLSKYSEIILSTGLPANSQQLLDLWNGLAPALEYVSGTADVTLTWADAQWSVTGEALGWAVDAAFAGGRFTAKLEPLSPEYQHIQPIILDSRDAQAFGAFLTDILASVSADAFSLRFDNDDISNTVSADIHINTSSIVACLSNGIPSALMRHQDTLEMLIERYGYLFEPLDIYDAADLGETLSQLVSVPHLALDVNLRCDKNAGIWHFDTSYSFGFATNIRLTLQGEPGSLSGRIYLPNAYRAYDNIMCITVDANWAKPDFSFLLSAHGWDGEQASFSVHGSRQEDGYRLEMLGSDNYGVYLNAQLTADAHGMQLTGTMDGESLAGSYSRRTGLFTITVDDEQLLCGAIDPDGALRSLTLTLDGLLRIAVTGNNRSFYTLQLNTGTFALDADIRLTSRYAFEAGVRFGNYDTEIIFSRQHKRLRIDYVGSLGEMRLSDTLTAFLLDYRPLEKAFILNAKTYYDTPFQLSITEKMLALTIDHEIYQLEDVTADGDNTIEIRLGLIDHYGDIEETACWYLVNSIEGNTSRHKFYPDTQPTGQPAAELVIDYDPQPYAAPQADQWIPDDEIYIGLSPLLW